jgi:cytochrome c oxidase cbb3-type subunit 3
MNDENKTKEEKESVEGVVHVYDDDIVEHDNRLPLWWQYTLYGAIVFAIFYWVGERGIGAWPTQREKFEDEMVAARLEAAKKGAAMTPAVLLAMSHAPKSVDAGHTVFTATCAPCHRADGGGNIGPNLTDGYWLHGSKPENIFSCVHDGIPAKGMPTWAPQLGEEKVAEVVAYVLTIKNTNVPNGKAPQGEPE